MDTWNINGCTLEYDDDTHTYLVDGLIVPSVTQILQIKFSSKYNFVKRDVLQAAAERGTAIHKAVENYCKDGIPTCQEAKNFRWLKYQYNFSVLENETPIIIFKNDMPVAAGRLDLVLDIDGETAIADIKTTSTLDKEYLAYQLNLYRLGYTQSYGIQVHELYGVHLRENIRKIHRIPVNDRIAYSILEEYERSVGHE